VCWDKEGDLWMALININGKRKYLGRFATKGKAMLAYSKAARKAFGQFVRLV
jgi:hypothetical protein